MHFQSVLYRGRLVDRISLVLADICLENSDIVTAYCSNMSLMKSLTVKGTNVLLSFNRHNNRRLLYTWETASVNGTWVGVNMGRTYDLVVEGIQNGVLFELQGYEKIDPVLPSRGSSLFDVRLTPFDQSFPVCNVAIDNAYLKSGIDVSYPDGIVVAHHRLLKEIDHALDQKERVVLVTVAQRLDCIGVKANWICDADYIAGLKNLCDKGLEILCYGCTVSDQGIWITARLPFSF